MNDVDGSDVPGEAVEDLAAKLVGFDTRNPPGETVQLIEYLADRLEDQGLDVEQYATDPAKPNLQVGLSGSTDRTLCFQGHADTVPFDPPNWSHDPLGEWDGDRLYGRGASDMKGQLAAMVVVLEAAARADVPPPTGLRLCVVSDEETGGNAGLAALVEADRVDVDACVIGETTCIDDRHSVTVADRGSIWLTLAATGEAAHGSRPMQGTNAIDRIYEAITQLRSEFGSRRLSLATDVAPIIEESVAYYEPSLGSDTARTLFEYPTINLGIINGGEAVNTVPATARAELDIRLTAGVDTKEILGSIRSCVAGCEGVSVEDVSWSIGSYEPVDSPLVEAVANTAHDVLDGRIYRRSATGGGDAKSLRQAGVPTVEFGVGTDTVHGVDEFTTRDALRANASVYARLPTAFAQAS